MARITVEDCLEKISNQYDLVLLAKERTSQLNSGAEMLVEKDISFYSNCEHHFVPIIGKAHVAYKSNGKVIGLSKINRIVDYFSKRPQVQERLTRQIALELTKILDTEDVAVLIYAKHLCVASRGIKDDTSETFTAYYGGEFKNKSTKNELFSALQNC